MKKIILCIIFCLINIFILQGINEIIVPKAYNRYYILEKYLENIDRNFDIEVYGSCHSYTSFNPTYLKEEYGISSFVFGNAGEIMPVTYLRMLENFKEYTPKQVFVEIWGINPYETYDSTEEILGGYLDSNLERLPLTKEKIEVIKDFDKSILEMSFPIARYKDRIMNNTIFEHDFSYTFEGTKAYSNEYTYSEMESRLSNNGFKVYPSQEVKDYEEKQSTIKGKDYLKIESNIVKYIKKVIELCKEYNVELVFYRSPYVSTKNELKKLKHFKEICDEYEVTFVDLEEVIKYDYKTDFYDEYHLSVVGANKATKYLVDNYVLKDM